MAKKTCNFSLYIWGPHPGCAEFMDGPETVVECESPATHRGWSDYPYVGRQRAYSCARHAAEDVEIKYYRFRTV